MRRDMQGGNTNNTLIKHHTVGEIGLEASIRPRVDRPARHPSGLCGGRMVVVRMRIAA
jgi:hypothetical protein